MAAPNTLTSDLLPSTQLAYVKKALERLVPGFVYYKTCQADPESYKLPENGGRTAVFFRYNNLTANTTPLDQVSAGAGVVVSRETVEATVAEYGTYTLVPGLVRRTDIDPSVIKNIEEVLADNARETLDLIARDTISSNAQVVYANGSAVGTIDSGDTLTLLDVMKQVAKLQAARVKPYDDGFYKAILHTYQAHDLFVETSTGNIAIRDLKKYDDAKNLDELMKPDFMTGRIGSIGNIMFYQTDLAKSAVVNSISTREAFVMGKGGFGAVSVSAPASGFNIFVNYSGEGQISDPYRRQTTVAWYIPTFAVANLDDNAASSKNTRAIKIISATSLD